MQRCQSFLIPLIQQSGVCHHLQKPVARVDPPKSQQTQKMMHITTSIIPYVNAASNCWEDRQMLFAVFLLPFLNLTMTTDLLGCKMKSRFLLFALLVQRDLQSQHVLHRLWYSQSTGVMEGSTALSILIIEELSHTLMLWINQKSLSVNFTQSSTFFWWH